MAKRERFYATKHDKKTYQVVDRKSMTEVCVVGSYDEETLSAKIRADQIVFALNQTYV